MRLADEPNRSHRASRNARCNKPLDACSRPALGSRATAPGADERFRRARWDESPRGRLPPMTRDGDPNIHLDAHELPADLAEAALGVTPEQLERYADVIDRLLEGTYFSLDEEGKISAWTSAAEASFGWPGHEVLGEDFFEF